MHTFLLYLAKIFFFAPTIVKTVVDLKNETGAVTAAQEASDSLHALTGIADGLLSDDPQKQQAADAASSVVQGIINAASGPKVAPVTPPAGATAAAVTNSAPAA